MGRKKKVPSAPSNHFNPSAHWVVSEEWTANGRHLVKGTEVSIRGERGRFQFVKHVYNPNTGSEWVDVVGGPANVRQFRSFSADRIKTVHYKNKIRQPKPRKKDVE